MSDNCWEINYTWLVKDIKELMDNRQTRYSPTFKNENAEWRLIISTELLFGEENYRFFVAFECLKGFNIPWTKITFSIMHSKYDGISISLSKIISSEWKTPFKFYFRTLLEMKYYIYNNTLKIVCKVTELTREGEETQTSAYESLMDNETLSDVKLLVGDMKFSAHKVFLHAHSPVFEKMFSHEKKESINNEVEIMEMSLEIFQELLRYMYTGKVNNLEEKAPDILIAANRYEIKDLVLMCSNFLCSTITLANVAELLKLAEDHNASILKGHCSHFIMQNFKEFVKSEEYKDLLKTHVRSIADIATKIGLECEVTLKE